MVEDVGERFARWDTILIHHETDENQIRLLGCKGGKDLTLGRGSPKCLLDGL